MVVLCIKVAFDDDIRLEFSNSIRQRCLCWTPLMTSWMMRFCVREEFENLDECLGGRSAGNGVVRIVSVLQAVVTSLIRDFAI